MANTTDLPDVPLDMFRHPFRSIRSKDFPAHAFIFPTVCFLICVVALTIEHYRRSRWPDEELEQEEGGIPLVHLNFN